MMATVNQGDEVIIPAPYWVSYPDIVLLAGGNPIIIKCSESENFKITPEKLKNSITTKTPFIQNEIKTLPGGKRKRFTLGLCQWLKVLYFMYSNGRR